MKAFEESTTMSLALTRRNPECLNYDRNTLANRVEKRIMPCFSVWKTNLAQHFYYPDDVFVIPHVLTIIIIMYP